MPSTSSPNGLLCLGLLLVVIVLQLYVISLWFQPGANSASQSTIRYSASNTGVTSARNFGASENGVVNLDKPVETHEAIQALHVLSQYIRAIRDSGHNGNDKVIRVTKPNSNSDEAKPGHSHHEHTHHDRDDDLDGTVVGKEDQGSHADSAHDHHAGDTHDEEFLQKNKNLYQQIWLNISASWSEDILSPSYVDRLSAEQQKRHRRCEELQAQGEVIPDQSWGHLPQNLHAEFDSLECSNLVSLKHVATYVRDNPDLYNRVWWVDPNRQVVKPEPGMEDKVIAVIVAMTTRGVTINKLDDLALFKSLLPSYARTLDPGFEYWFYLGYDYGDPWLDNEKNLELVRAFFDEKVAAVALEQGIVTKLVFSSWENKFRRPGPAFNYVCGVAYADGATWMYRINDDQFFDTPWAQAFVNALTEMGPPYGVVGPACSQGATHILVVDFVHRTHHEIFPTHYPPSLQAWYMDNWVSQIYGKKRTKRVNSARITHLIHTHNTRYPVIGFAQYSRGEVVRGRAVFEEYLSHTPGMAEQLKEYRSDSFNYAI